MSPSKTRPQFVPARPRSEVYTAVGVAAGIVLGTALLIWLIRPGTPGVLGGGGLFNRQPRMTILVLLTLIVLAIAVSYFARRRHPGRMGTQGSIAISAVVILAASIAGGIFWPGGVIHHWPKQPKIPTTPVTTPQSIPTPTTVKAKTTTTTKTGTTKTGTTKPGTPTTTAAATTPTTATAPTTLTPTTTAPAG